MCSIPYRAYCVWLCRHKYSEYIRTPPTHAVQFAIFPRQREKGLKSAYGWANTLTTAHTHREITQRCQTVVAYINVGPKLSQLPLEPFDALSLHLPQPPSPPPFSTIALAAIIILLFSSSSTVSSWHLCCFCFLRRVFFDVLVIFLKIFW